MKPMEPQQIPVAVTRPGHPLAIVWLQLVVHLPNGGRREVAPTSEAIEHELRVHFGSTWSSYRIIAPEDIPSDRRYRSAWRDAGSHIEVDLALARPIHREAIRLALLSRLRALADEIVAAIADDRTDDAIALRARRRQLEALPNDPRIDAARSVAELAAVDPVAELAP